MKNVFKRVMAALLSLIMVLSLAACGETTKPTDAPTDAPKATDAPATNAPEDKGTEAPTEAAEFDPKSITDGVTLTIAVEADDEVIDWDTNLTTLMLEEKFGVDLKFEAYAAGSFGDKLNVMINGGDELPDIIFGSGTKGLDSYQTNWVETGAILELTEFYENPDYAKNVNLAMEKEGAPFVETMRDANGKIWALPKYYPSVNDATAYRLWINRDYAKAVGFDELPTTTEGFFELCKAFAAAGDLNGNGLDDEVIFSGKDDVDEPWFKFLMSAFVYTWDDKRLDVEDGTLTFAYATDEWKEGLKYIKQFFDEGLLDTTILTQDKAAYQTVVYNSEMPYLADVYYNPQMQMPSTEEANRARVRYGSVPGLEGPNKEAESYYSDPVAYPGAMITADCENPEAAFIVLDYLMTQEMGIYQRWGEEGVDWDWYENVDDSKFIDGTTKDMYLAENGIDLPDFISYTNSKYWGTGTPQNKGYMLAGPGIQFTTGVGRVLQNPVTDEQKVTLEWTGYFWKQVVNEMLEIIPEREERIITLPMTGEESSEIAEPQKVIDKYYQEAAANFITGVWDIDEYWDTYLAELEKMGMNDVLAIYQTAFDRTK